MPSNFSGACSSTLMTGSSSTPPLATAGREAGRCLGTPWFSCPGTPSAPALLGRCLSRSSLKKVSCAMRMCAGMSLMSLANWRQKSSSSSTFFIFSRRTTCSRRSFARRKSACRFLSFLCASLSFFLVRLILFSSFSRGRNVECGELSWLDVAGWKRRTRGLPSFSLFLRHHSYTCTATFPPILNDSSTDTSHILPSLYDSFSRRSTICSNFSSLSVSFCCGSVWFTHVRSASSISYSTVSSISLSDRCL
mmetsp:Transcript_44516/g.108718  ORF Transcript_44516/g.108718 Transcript_44516/m.108718 type:complete len:250 (-) Transcript_44516:365-1114(-)